MGVASEELVARGAGWGMGTNGPGSARPAAYKSLAPHCTENLESSRDGCVLYCIL